MTELPVTVKKAEARMPHWLELLLPWIKREWRPLGREEVSMVAETLAMVPPKEPDIGEPEPSPACSSIE